MKLQFILCCLAVSGLVALSQGFQVPSSARASVVLAAEAPVRIEVCQKKHCKKRGSATTLRLFEALAGDSTLVETADMSHTDHGCFDECTMGPNVRVDGGGALSDEGRVVNGVKGAAAVAEVLGVTLEDGWTLPPATEAAA